MCVFIYIKGFLHNLYIFTTIQLQHARMFAEPHQQYHRHIYFMYTWWQRFRCKNKCTTTYVVATAHIHAHTQ